MGLADYIGKYWAGAEVIYAVIIAMTFTSILRGYVAVPEFVLSKIIYSAFFCCMAWGIADGSFYAWERQYITRQENKIIDLSRSPRNGEDAISLIREQLDDTVLRNISEENRQKLYQKLVDYLSDAGTKQKLSSRDALAIILNTFLVSTIAGLIVILPFLLVDDLNFALDTSNLLGISLLFIVGFFRAYERTLFAKIVSGFGTAIIGIIVAMITVIFGG